MSLVTTARQKAESLERSNAALVRENEALHALLKSGVLLQLPDDCADLIPAIQEVVEVLSHGAKTKPAFHWRDRCTWAEHYDHAEAHENRRLSSNTGTVCVDAESGLRDSAHSVARRLIMLALEIREEQKRG